ncbi:ABC transporter permease [Marinoscillum sp.]|uniref:ABC transporter permease n=1 Tax=Marinoscillum sp. TaxID=2024838 RepID=UPI003BABA61A
MLRNYFITAFRNFKNNKVYSLLNIIGLGVGLASCLFVFTIIRYEYSFDNWHEKKDRVYRVVRHYYGDNGVVSHSGIIPYPTGDELIRTVPDLEKVVQFHGPEDEKIALTDETGNLQVFRENKILYTDENFFDVLDFEILEGAEGSILAEPYKVFLSEDIAKKYFGNSSPIGQTLTFNNTDQLEVVGIVENCPDNTNLPYNIIASLPTMRRRMPDVFKDNWGMTWAYSAYILAPKSADIKQIEDKMEQALEAHSDEEDKAKQDIKLQPLEEIHNDERYGDGNNYVTPSLMIWAFVILGLLLLGTACLNFINLSTAQAIKRAKEVGIRKTLGGQKAQLIGQFLAETLVIVLCAMVIALTLGQVMISKFNEFLAEIEYNLGYSGEIILFGIILALIVTFLAGFYPSMILSGYKPVEALSNQINIKKGSGNFKLRRVLVITQFAFTNLMLITTIIIASQMNYVKSRDLGFSYDDVVLVNFPDDQAEKMKTILGDYQKQSYVDDATIEYTAPLSGSNWNNSYFEVGQDYQDGNNSSMKFGDEHFLEFYNIPMVTGRMFNPGIITDTTGEAVVNRKLIATLGYEPEEALGKHVDYGYQTLTIVGVMENFHVHPLQRDLRPTTLSYNPGQFNQIALKLKRSPNSEILSGIETIFRDYYPEDLFEFSILNDEINDHYLLENLLHQIIQFVAVITILLSAMGLYGLVSFMANKNAKTIGIRKVFGASVPHILGIFIKEYVFLLVFAFALSAPAAWWLSGLWLEEFTYRIDVTYIYFFAGFLLSVLIALVTVGYKSYQAATSNPINSLRYE